MRIGLIPLDERPANTRYPAMIAEIAGAELALPPADVLSERRRPGNCGGLAAWLAAAAPKLDGLLVSLEMLGHGGLIASRTTDEPAAAALARLEALRDLRRRHPQLPIYAFSVITRVSNADDAVEEPDYWARYGARLYRLSELLDRRQQGHPVAAELAALEAELPAAHRRDFLGRRLRNHLVNGGALQLLADGVLDLLVLSSDDTSPFGLPSREKRWLAGWADLLDLSGPGSPLLMYPGADEVGCALLARMLNRRAGVSPAIAVSYAPPAAASNIAAYEDGPISLTIERQVLAVGGRLANGGADFWLGVDAPLERRGEWDPTFAEDERAARHEALAGLVSEASRAIAGGRRAAIADVAYPNGADPALLDLMLSGLDLPVLAAYGAWNTAGNTIGTVLAQACALGLADSRAGRQAHERFLLHRLVEDWGYQHRARAALRAWLRESHGAPEPKTPALYAASCAQIEASLNETIDRLPGFAKRYRVAPGSVRLPWGRTFEVDFTLLPEASSL